MYAWLWRHLPGETLVRVATALGAVFVVALVLWYLVFPWVEPKLQFDHGTVEGGTSAPSSPRP
jgi:drug/metabolite transporter superfamily protein YnfA